MSNLITAPELKVRINGVLAGYATGFSYRVTQGQKMTFGVDSPFPQEIAQGAAPSFVEGQFTVLRPQGGSPEAWGFMTPRSSVDGLTETGDPQSTALGSAKYSTIEITNRESDELIIKITHVMFDRQDWQVSARGLMQGSVSFQGVIAF
jgi:hypothetical protein